MPEFCVGLDLIPRRNSGDRRVHDHQAAYDVRIKPRHRIGDHAAIVVADDVGALQLQRHDELANVLRQIRDVVTGAGRTPDAAHVGSNDGERPCQARHDPVKPCYVLTSTTTYC